MVYGDYQLNNINTLKRPMSNKELQQYYYDEYNKYPYDCISKKFAHDSYIHFMQLNIKESINGIIRRGGC